MIDFLQLAQLKENRARNAVNFKSTAPFSLARLTFGLDFSNDPQHPRNTEQALTVRANVQCNANARHMHVQMPSRTVLAVGNERLNDLSVVMVVLVVPAFVVAKGHKVLFVGGF